MACRHQLKHQLIRIGNPKTTFQRERLIKVWGASSFYVQIILSNCSKYSEKEPVSWLLIIFSLEVKSGQRKEVIFSFGEVLETKLLWIKTEQLLFMKKNAVTIDWKPLDVSSSNLLHLNYHKAVNDALLSGFRTFYPIQSNRAIFRACCRRTVSVPGLVPWPFCCFWVFLVLVYYSSIFDSFSLTYQCFEWFWVLLVVSNL